MTRCGNVNSEETSLVNPNRLYIALLFLAVSPAEVLKQNECTVTSHTYVQSVFTQPHYYAHEAVKNVIPCNQTTFAYVSDVEY